MRIIDFRSKDLKSILSDMIIMYFSHVQNLHDFSRFIECKQLLKSLLKYYFIDSGIRNPVLSNANTDVGHMLENIVYLELLKGKKQLS